MSALSVNSIRVSGLALVTLLSAAAMPAAAPAGSGGDHPQARAYYKPCGSFRYRGKHDLFKHAYGCAKAKKKSRYVLRNRKAPRGWSCSLERLRKGRAICTSGGKAFLFVPRR